MRITIVYSSFQRVDFRTLSCKVLEDLYNTNNRNFLKSTKTPGSKILSKGMHTYVFQTFFK